MTPELATLEVESAPQLRTWLSEHHTQAAGIWLVTYKKCAGPRYLSASEVLDELLCFGWTDGRRQKLDDQRTMQLISPRRTQIWAQTYKGRASRLAAQGRMHPAGLERIEQSKAQGLWEASAEVDALTVPADLAQMLAAQPPAGEHFGAFAPSYRRNVLRWIDKARTPDTRLSRLQQTTELAASNRKVPQF